MAVSFKIHVIPGYICSIFLLEYPHGLLLLDSGAINDVKRIEDYCENVLSRPTGDIRLAVVTHSHPDHSGGANTLRRRHHIPIAAHYSIDRWYSGVGGFIQHKLDCAMATEVAVRNKRHLERILFRRRINPDYPLVDEQRLPLFPDWQVLHSPGHTLHDMVLYNEDAGIMYTGDCICGVKGNLYLPLPIMFPRQMKESFERLSKLNPHLILLAHGEPIATDQPAQVFTFMKELVDNPPNTIMKRVHWLSVYSPEIRAYRCFCFLGQVDDSEK